MSKDDILNTMKNLDGWTEQKEIKKKVLESGGSYSSKSLNALIIDKIVIRELFDVERKTVRTKSYFYRVNT